MTRRLLIALGVFAALPSFVAARSILLTLPFRKRDNP